MTTRIGGTIHRLQGSDASGKGAFGIVIGDDSRHYFFLPSGVRPPLRFDALREETRVQFETFQHARGMRVSWHSLTVIEASVAVNHAEA